MQLCLNLYISPKFEQCDLWFCVLLSRPTCKITMLLYFCCSSGEHYVQKIVIEETTTTTTQRPTASSATKELDDLMASLSDFKVIFYSYKYIYWFF